MRFLPLFMVFSVLLPVAGCSLISDFGDYTFGEQDAAISAGSGGSGGTISEAGSTGGGDAQANPDSGNDTGPALGGVGDPCQGDDSCSPGLHCENEVCCAVGSTCCTEDTHCGEGVSCDTDISECQAARCAVDQHVVGHACEPCPAGTTNEAGDDASGGDTGCDPVLCAADQRVSSHACVACPAGMTNEAGDDASGGDTVCDGDRCASNQHVVNHACEPCPAGTTNKAGADASGDDTGCDPILCGVDDHVADHACVACPAGTTNEAGDDASGDDTGCDPVLCAVDYRVQDHECVKCPEDQVNEAGDDASGPDTYCDAAGFNIAFLSPVAVTGKLGGLDGADDLCAGWAEDAGIPGTYRAILSTETVNAKDRLTGARGWIRRDRRPLGDLPSDIFQDAALLTAVRIGPDGTDLGHRSAWSASDRNGVYTTAADGTDCGGWTSAGEEMAWYGFSDTTYEWLNRGTRTACKNEFHIYCFQVDYNSPLDKSDFAEEGRRLFVSTGKFDTTTGLDGANALCSADVEAYGLGGSFKALLADVGQSPASHFSPSNMAIIRLDGLFVASNIDALSTEDIVHPPVYQGDGARWNFRTFTGSSSPNTVGSDSTTCTGWSTTSGTATIGFSYSTSRTSSQRIWFGHENDNCTRSGELPVYCLEE
jgi:hypothetical protein